MRRTTTGAVLTAVLLLLHPPLLPAATASSPPARGWLHFDAPLWDLANDGLPARVTWSLRGEADFLARMLGAQIGRASCRERV